MTTRIEPGNRVLLRNGDYVKVLKEELQTYFKVELMPRVEKWIRRTQITE
jgi:hypothetical protein